jgi:hypothetical protein
MEQTKPKKRGRPPKPPGEGRSARLQMRTFPDVVEKAARVGSVKVEAAIRGIKESK